MNGWVEKVKLVGCELAEVSKLPDEEAIERERESREQAKGFYCYGKIGNKIIRRRRRRWSRILQVFHWLLFFLIR
jgi:hypothetical protein